MSDDFSVAKNSFCFCCFQSNRQNWGTESAIHALKKEANWIPFVTMIAERDPLQENTMAELRCQKNIDLLLQAQSNFLKAADHEVSLYQVFVIVLYDALNR